jgi:hypothetical protein
MISTGTIACLVEVTPENELEETGLSAKGLADVIPGCILISFIRFWSRTMAADTAVRLGQYPAHSQPANRQLQAKGDHERGSDHALGAELYSLSDWHKIPVRSNQNWPFEDPLFTTSLKAPRPGTEGHLSNRSLPQL